MSANCCASETGAGTSAKLETRKKGDSPACCPICGEKGKSVNNLTLKAMLSISLMEVRDTSYRFCHTTDCEVVYFAVDGEQVFTRAQVREAVYQKEPHNPNVLICYCFQHSLASIRAEIFRTGRSTVVEQINAGIQSGQCACDIRNPQGSCCLGNVIQIVGQIKEAMTTTHPSTGGKLAEPPHPK